MKTCCMYMGTIFNGLVLFELYLLLCQVEGIVLRQELGGKQWNARGTKPPSTLVTVVPANVPGCIHTDWYNNSTKSKEKNLYYRSNDVDLRWIAQYDWQYKKTFQVDRALLTRNEQWLVCEGLDTIATVILNGKVLGTSKNMFVRHVFNVTDVLQEKFNQISVDFKSAIRAAEDRNKTLKYMIPPECPPDVQHGSCHVNLIRKEQCSLSWDWGPGFATQGIWKPIRIIALDESLITDATTMYDWRTETLKITSRLQSTGARKARNGTLSVVIGELGIHKMFNIDITKSSDASSNFTVAIPINSKSFELWWPNGQGDQKLYNISIQYNTTLMTDSSSKLIRFGFRKVELVQEAINGSSGLSFYFKINDRPVFAKGSNWIPADSFKSRITPMNYTTLLNSAKEANMNMLRVWGGGIYEDNFFYELADELGIMIWHDFMFACAMYPADADFLSSVSEEVKDTLWRVSSHPSIVIWSGNNENEAALGTNWYNTSNNFSRYKSDYVSLYINAIGNSVTSFDTSRPFLSSSPTNGKESAMEGWVAKNPYDNQYGDVHYYNYNADCLDWTKYPKTRFASEYGFQSWPSLETLKPVSIDEDWSWTSKFADHRQHHMDGNNQILDQISMHFKLPDNEDPVVVFEDKIYLSQIMQALCYKSETEFYRRSRSEIVKGEGHTMGALYWQLNDIWQAPTWSSIEYGGKWKAVHYFAKNFFANVALTAFDDDSVMTIYSISDEMTPIEPVTLVIEMRTWSSFDIRNTWLQPIYITPQSSKLQYQNSTGTMLHYGGCDYKELCFFTIRLKELPDVAPTYFFPVNFKDIVGLKKAKITTSSVQYKSSTSDMQEYEAFEILLTTTAPAAFVWLEASNIKGRFSDNAFFMYDRNKTVIFLTWEPGVQLDQLTNAIKVKSLSDLYAEQAADITIDLVVPSLTSDYWLNDISSQLAWAVCGILFIMFCATMLVCVVMRFNSPRSGSPSIISGKYSSNKDHPLLTRSLSVTEDEEDTPGAFMIKMKSGYGHRAKNVEIKFYVN